MTARNTMAGWTTSWTGRRPWGALAYLGAVCLLCWGVWVQGQAQALGQVAARGQADLALAADRLVTGLMRYRAAAVLLADHPVLKRLHLIDSMGIRAEAEAFLLQSADRTGAVLALYADREGRVLAASQPFDGGTTLTEASWFQRATEGALGAGYGLGAEGDRLYTHAAPSFGPDGKVRGVLVMVVDLEGIEGTWRGSRPSVFFTDDQSGNGTFERSDDGGEIIVTNRSEMLFWRFAQQVTRADGTPAELRRRNVAGFPVWRQDWSVYVPRRALYLEQPLPVVRMTAVALVDVAPAQRVAALQVAVVAALCMAFGAVLWMVGARRRALAAANATLEARVRSRTRALEDANSALCFEVSEREDAEAALRRAQAELVQAGKLSALGQMSAGISHELNQPLMAIRQFAENGGAFLARGRPEKAGENLTRIAELAARAARIIRNLRAFAQGESEPMTRVDLGRVLAQAVELTETRLSQEDVALDAPQIDEVFVRGGEVRLGQVLVNLINNAVDAMAEQSDKRIRIAVETGDRVTLRVRDSGPGIADPEKVFEPFYSTKEVGSGMGLGLSISYGLVQSFGGNIRGANVEGGAEFTVELEPWPVQEDS